MTNEVMKTNQRNLDGFAGFEDGIEGGDEQVSNRRIEGLQLKFSNDFRWLLPEDEEFPINTELVASDIVRVVQRWGKDKTQGPIEERELAPGERFPDFEKLNAAIPQSEWLEGFDGKPRGPWQGAMFLYLLDPITLDQFTYIVNLSTIGACIAIRELADKVEWMRKIKNNQNLYAVVQLSDTFMNTRFGGRQRPHFLIKRWVAFGAGSDKALPPADAPQLGEALDSAEQTPQQTGMQTVTPPTAKEATGDEIPF